MPPAVRIKGLSNYTLSRLGPRAHQHPAKEMRSWAVGFRSAGAYWIEYCPKKIRRRARNVCPGGALFQTGALKFPATEFGQRPCQSLGARQLRQPFLIQQTLRKAASRPLLRCPQAQRESREYRGSWSCQPGKHDRHHDHRESNQHPVLECHAKEREPLRQPASQLKFPTFRKL